jgi:hypothetical protein
LEEKVGLSDTISQVLQQLRYIEIICISAKLVISSKISLEFDGVPTTDFLPVSGIMSIINMLRYV